MHAATVALQINQGEGQTVLPGAVVKLSFNWFFYWAKIQFSYLNGIYA